MYASHRGAGRLAAVAGAVLASLALAGPAHAKHDGGLSLEWAPCGEAGAECATASVPKDYDKPRLGTLDVAVAKSPATDPSKRIGSLFFNFGGPGAPAAAYIEAFGGAALFPVLNERFDIVGVDPRGTNGSNPLDCLANQETEGVYSKPFVTPDTLDVNALLRKDIQYIGKCIRNNDNLEFLSTANTARDMNAVRAAVGDRKMTYLGFSYGTFLGATIQSLFPGKTRAVVLDGAVDPDQYINDPLDALDEQTAGFERAISRYLIACAADPGACPFGDGDPKGTLDDLIEQADATPIAASETPDRPVTGDDIRAALASEVYSLGAWAELTDALVALEAGDGQGIREIADGFWGRLPDGSYDPGTDRYFLLSADEQHYPRNVKPFLKAGKSSYQDYDYAFWNHGYSELNWGLYPIRARDAYDGPFRTGRRDPTTLVVATRYDPATTYKQGKRMARQLGNARLLTMTGDGHTAYDGDPSDGYNSQCADLAIEAYLIAGTLPAAGTKCEQDAVPFPGAVQSLKAERDDRLVIRRGTRPLRLP